MRRELAEREEGTFEGNSLRLWNPATERWTIWWVDSRDPTLRLQVEGTFQDNRGELKMRFLWKDITDTSAVWEQAYQHPETGEWETNWIMELTAVP